MTLFSGFGARLLAALRRVRPHGGRLLLSAALLGVAPAAALAVTGSGVVGVEAAVRHGHHPLAPVIALPQIDGGRRVSLADYRGQVVLLSFYATWCPPCVRGLPALTQLNDELHA
jgi:thiol-disulfide isomerase/thioredoxin